jgi:hypothetical protein
MMFFLRYFFLLFAFVGLLISTLFWHSAEPPAWSIFLPTTQAKILDTRIETRSIGNGGTYYYPVVEVDWPDAPGGRETLVGLQSTFTEKSRANAEMVLRQYQASPMTAVRVIDHHPYADRTDIFSLGGAIFASVLTVFGLVMGGVMSRALRSR